ncbi:Cj0069 family protein [Variovorax sp. J22R24]|uniref:Cj0069 family protein n=1 Tax=Variovorax gracilis TaxID=3053502 RepID=UPI00257872F2|nr:Cj0069 family protein [Variovorax sp. J22R24]MDM0109709.1 Cj0069 family protein [Variovorax sp. J22R24]
MTTCERPRLAIVYPGDRAARDRSDPAQSRFGPLFEAFDRAGVAVEPAIYNDDFREEVREQLLRMHGVLVWHNPVEGGRDRRVLDAVLRDAAAQGVVVSAHPETILRMGTKDVLLSVRNLPFGSDVHRVDSLTQLASQLPRRLAGGARVLKQRRGQSGVGVWRIEQRQPGGYALRHAQRGCKEELVDLAGVGARLAPYFDDGGYMIDQAWQPRMVEGMTRAYLVRDRVAGFGHQAVVALHPADDSGKDVPTSTRLYSGSDDPRFQGLREQLEDKWVGLLCEQLQLERDALPLLWDADFLLGEPSGESEGHVLCEINVSSVSPFPDSAIPMLVRATTEAMVAAAER